MQSEAKIRKSKLGGPLVIIGDGLIATEFKRQEFRSRDTIILASGVSNSTEASEIDYARERKLITSLLGEYASLKVIYFSSVGVSDMSALAESRYIAHKLEMENLIKKHTRYYQIFRLPQLVGPNGNPMTIVNFLHRQIASGRQVTVLRSAERNLLDVEDFVKLAIYSIQKYGAQKSGKYELTAPKNIRVTRIIEILEEIIGRKARINMSNEGSYKPRIDKFAELIADQAGVKFDSEYYYKLLKKYYGK